MSIHPPRPVLGALIALTVVSTATAQDQVFRVAADTVPVFVTVTDRDDRLVTTLTRDQFEVRDDGRPQPITLFDNTPQPINLIVMLDVSGSMAGNLRLLRAASRELFRRLGPDDRVRVGTFGDDVVIEGPFTRDPVELAAMLPEEINPSAPTPLWRGLNDAITELTDVGGRRVVLVLSDGGDSGPQWNQRFVGELDVRERAQHEDVMVYAIGLQSRTAFAPQPGANLGAMLGASLPDPALGRAAVETGGGYFELRPRDDLAAAFARVADELHSQYLLGFAPPRRDGDMHRIDVRLTTRGLNARARREYRAPEDR